MTAEGAKGKYQRWQTGLCRAPWFARLFVRTMGDLADPIYEWAWQLMAEDFETADALADVGCGNALMSRRVARGLSDRRRHFFLIDQSQAQIEAGREVIREIASRNHVTSYATPAEDNPLADASVDVLYTTGSINLWNDPVRGLEQCKRVVKPGGVLWLYDQRPCNTPELAFDALFVKRVFGLGLPGYTAEEVLEFARQAGLPAEHDHYPNMSLYGLRWQL